MMKFLHTADWQIGMKAQSLGDAGSRVRDERFAACRRVIAAAKAHAAEFILIAGDTFEDNAVDRVLVQKVADIVGGAGMPVFIIPGNHDPLTPGSVWDHPAWKSSGNVSVLREAMPVEIKGAVLYPCPVQEKHSGIDPTAWITADQGAVIRIGLAHGTVEGVQVDEPDYPIARNAAERAKLDYLALGHWHSYGTYPDGKNCVKTAYSGTHETTRFGERDSGNVLLIEISAPCALPTITPIRTGGLVWKRVEKDTRDAGDLTKLRQEMEAAADPGSTLVEVLLTGVMMAEERDELDHIEQLLASRFLFGRLNASRLRPSPQDDAWLSNLPTGVIREAANRLRSEAATPGPTSETAAKALMELYAIAGEVAQ